MMDMKNLGAGGQWRGSRVYYLGAEWFWKVSEKGETEKEIWNEVGIELYRYQRKKIPGEGLERPKPCNESINMFKKGNMEAQNRGS